jgi:hypothetical protein
VTDFSILVIPSLGIATILKGQKILGLPEFFEVSLLQFMYYQYIHRHLAPGLTSSK